MPSFFAGGDREAERLNNLPKVTAPGSWFWNTLCLFEVGYENSNLLGSRLTKTQQPSTVLRKEHLMLIKVEIACFFHVS